MISTIDFPVLFCLLKWKNLWKISKAYNIEHVHSDKSKRGNNGKTEKRKTGGMKSDKGHHKGINNSFF